MSPEYEKSQKSQISDLKRQANKINAQRSSGPKTESGKRASRRNATKHGVFVSETISIALGERAADFNALLRELRDVWEPVGSCEERAVLEIAKTTWRKERVLRAEIGELAKGMNAYWSKTWDRQEQFSLDRLEWEVMHAQAEFTLYQGNKKSLLETLRERDETIHKLRRTMDGIDFVSGCVKTVRAEVEKTETLSETNLGLLLDCLGTGGLDLLAIAEDDEQLGKDALEMVLPFLDHQISVLNAQEQFLQTAIESESSAALQSLNIPSPAAANNLVRYETHLDRKLCRDSESLERRQAQRKKEE
jgi:hypothetical protein